MMPEVDIFRPVRPHRLYILYTDDRNVTEKREKSFGSIRYVFHLQRLNVMPAAFTRQRGRELGEGGDRCQ